MSEKLLSHLNSEANKTFMLAYTDVDSRLDVSEDVIRAARDEVVENSINIGIYTASSECLFGYGNTYGERLKDYFE